MAPPSLAHDQREGDSMVSLKSTLLYAAPDIAVNVAVAVTAKPKPGAGGGRTKPGSRLPFNVNALTDLQALAADLGRLAGWKIAYSVTDLGELWDAFSAAAQAAKPIEGEGMQVLLDRLATLNRLYPRRDDGTEQDTPCMVCGNARIVTLPVQEFGERLSHVCTDCGRTYEDSQLRAARKLALAVAAAEAKDKSRVASRVKHLERKYIHGKQ